MRYGEELYIMIRVILIWRRNLEVMSGKSNVGRIGRSVALRGSKKEQSGL
jgi:hypothetical protein